ncbi:hypothetical protein M3Y99_00099500 [Aphelenchoides fujianensis]|nr:hypothetical protein M3Y99_00099500 [Aphelenchoides fujianensis]
MKVRVQGREISNSNMLQPYRAYMELLSFGHGPQETHLQAAGFYPEKKLELTPALTNKFCFLSTGADTSEYRIVLDSAKLYVKNVEVVDGLALSFAQQHLTKPVLYPLKKVDMKSLFIAAGHMEYNATLWTDLVPRRIVIGLVKTSDYAGTTYNSPFNFVHGSVQNMTIMANGQRYSSDPFNLDFKKGRYVQMYHQMADNLGFAFTNTSNAISREMFAEGGFCLFVFNLTSDLEDSESFDYLKSGSTSLNIQFAEAVETGGYTAVVYSENDSILLIDAERVVSTNLTA